MRQISEPPYEVTVEIQIPPAVIIQHVGAESVWLDTRKGAYFELNEMGTLMLERLRKSQDSQETLSSLLSEFDVNEEALRQDFESLLQELQRQGLIKLKEPVT